jgi:hypothetical protein
MFRETKERVAVRVDAEMKMHDTFETVGMIAASLCVFAALASIRTVGCLYAGPGPNEMYLGFPPWITLQDDMAGGRIVRDFRIGSFCFILAISLLAGWIALRIIR